MLESKLSDQFEYSLNINPSRPIKDLIDEYGSKTIFLLQPEDTSDKATHRPHNLVSNKANSTSDVVKTLFWVAISIATAVAIGQLH